MCYGSVGMAESIGGSNVKALTVAIRCLREVPRFTGLLLRRFGFVVLAAAVCLLIAFVYFPAFFPSVRAFVSSQDGSDSVAFRRVRIYNWSMVPLTIEGAAVSCSCITIPSFPIVLERFGTCELDFKIDKERAGDSSMEVWLLSKAPHRRIDLRIYP